MTCSLRSSLFLTALWIAAWTPAQTAAPWQWQQLASAPVPMAGHSLIVNPADETMYAVGSDLGGAFLLQAYHVSGTGSYWEIVAPQGAIPGSRTRAACCLVKQPTNQFLYLHGGQTVEGATLNDFYRLNLVTKDWELITRDTPLSRQDHSVVYDAPTTSLIFFGGYNAQAPATERLFNDVWVYAIPTNEWFLQTIPNPPPPRQGHAAVLVEAESAMYISCGYQLEPERDLYRLDIREWVWNQLVVDDGFVQRQHHAMTYEPSNHRLVLFGGEINSDVYINDLWFYDLLLNQWTLVPAPNPPPRACPMVYNRLNHSMLIFGGEGPGRGELDETWQLELPTPENDICETAKPIFLNLTVTGGDTLYASNDYNMNSGNACTGTTALGGDVVYSLYPTQSGIAHVILTPLTPAFDASLYLLRSNCPNTIINCAVGSDNHGPGGIESITSDLAPYYDYYIMVDGRSTYDQGLFSLSYTFIASNPTAAPTETFTPTVTSTLLPTRSPTWSPTRSLSPTLNPTRTLTPTPSPSSAPSLTSTLTPSVTVTPTRTMTRTPTQVLTPTRTSTRTLSPTSSPTLTGTRTLSPTLTITVTPTRTLSPTLSPTRTLTPTLSPSSAPSLTSTLTPTGTITPTRTMTRTPTQALTPTRTSTLTPTRTLSPTGSPTLTATRTLSSTSTMTVTPTRTLSPTLSPTRTLTPTLSPSSAPSLTSTLTPTGTITPTRTMTRTPTQALTPTRTSTLTPTRTLSPTGSPTLTATRTLSSTSTMTVTPTRTLSSTLTPTRTLTPTPSPSGAASLTSTLTPTGTITPTRTMTRTPTQALTPTRTSTPTQSPSKTGSPTLTSTRTLSPTRTPTLVQTVSPTISPTAAPTSSLSPTLPATITPTSSPAPSRTRTASATNTVTPSFSPTPSETPALTPTPDQRLVTIRLLLNDTKFSAGERFVLVLSMQNHSNYRRIDEYIVLEVYGSYWFYPSWTAALDFRLVELGNGQILEHDILDFTWPPGAGSATGLLFWAVLTDSGTYHIASNLEVVEFGYE